MIFSNSHNFIFFAAGKTGTSSIEKILYQYRDDPPFDTEFEKYHKHIPPRIVKGKLDPGTWKKCFKFAFVRNPWDWVLSNYFWNKVHFEGRMRKRLRRLGLIGLTDQFTKKHFWEHWETMKRFRRDTHPENRFQFSFLADENDELLLDFVGRYENLQGDFDLICDRIGIERCTLPRSNVGKYSRKPYWEYYTDKTRALVADKYKKDIEEFGYTFDG
jgi:hypothetical protein